MDWLYEHRTGQERLTAALPLRLLFVTTSAGVGGIEVCSARLACHLQARGHQVTQVCRADGMVEALCHSLGVPTHRLSVRNSADLAAAGSMARIIVARSVDIVHVHSRRDFVSAVAAVALARQLGCCPRLVLHAHLAKPLGTPHRLSGFLFARGADGVIAVSDAVKSLLLAVHGLAQSFVHRIYNGVEWRTYAALPGTHARIRSRWGVPEDALVIGMVGRLDAKGQADLLPIIPGLLERFPSLHVVLVGPDEAGESRASLERQAHALGIGARVVCTGPSSDIPEAMSAFDILAHLPADEAFGMVLIEAMAAGLPVVATRVGGCPEIVKERDTGYLVRPGDKFGLAEALSGLLGSREARKRLGDAGQRVVQETFSLEGQLDQIERLYREMLDVPVKAGGSLPAPESASTRAS